MADYSRIVRLMKSRHGVRVRKWRRNMSGCAWRVSYHDGRSINWIEAPVPRTALSLSIFLHEVGHHAIGFEKFKKRCEEEYHVWQWALNEMRSLGVEPDEKVNRRFEMSMQYAVSKALRRGIKELPAPLVRFCLPGANSSTPSSVSVPAESVPAMTLSDSSPPSDRLASPVEQLNDQ